MKKNDVVGIIALKTGVSESKARSFIDTYTEIITQELIRGNRFLINSFGSYHITYKKPYIGFNKATGEDNFRFGAIKQVRFTASRHLKDKVNGRKR